MTQSALQSTVRMGQVTLVTSCKQI